MGMSARERARLELLERTHLFVVPFDGVVESALLPGVWSGRFGTRGGFAAIDEKPSLRWGLLSIEVDNEMLDLERDRDCREGAVGGTVDAT